MDIDPLETTSLSKKLLAHKKNYQPSRLLGCKINSAPSKLRGGFFSALFCQIHRCQASFIVYFLWKERAKGEPGRSPLKHG